MRHTISILVENKFGVLTRVAGLFSGRGYNIDSLNVAPTHDATVEQIVKQVGKLVDVVKVIDYRQGDYIDRELVLIRVATGSNNRAEVAQMAELFRAKVVDVQLDNLTIEITGGEGKIEKFINLMKDFGILDLTRTGQVALPRS